MDRQTLLWHSRVRKKRCKILRRQIKMDFLGKTPQINEVETIKFIDIISYYFMVLNFYCKNKMCFFTFKFIQLIFFTCKELNKIRKFQK